LKQKAINNSPSYLQDPSIGVGRGPRLPAEYLLLPPSLPPLFPSFPLSLPPSLPPFLSPFSLSPPSLSLPLSLSPSLSLSLPLSLPLSLSRSLASSLSRSLYPSAALQGFFFFVLFITTFRTFLARSRAVYDFLCKLLATAGWLPHFASAKDKLPYLSFFLFRAMCPQTPDLPDRVERPLFRFWVTPASTASEKVFSRT
jgi:hypothetical protein